MKELKMFILSLQFMTRIPINISINAGEDDFPKMAKYFPIVGVIIGAIASITFFAFKEIFPREIVSAIAIAVSYVLTGALHIDGFADTFDGLFSNKGRDRMLEIMRDSRLGTNGVLALLFLVILKVLFLSKVKSALLYPTLILMPLIGRFSILLAAFTSKSARSGEGLGGLIIGKISGRDFLLGFMFVLIFGYFLTPYVLFLKVLAIFSISSYITTRYISARIGGMTGDTLGAINEIEELIVIISVFLLKG